MVNFGSSHIRSQSHFSCSLWWLLVDPCRHKLLLSSLRRVTRPGHQSSPVHNQKKAIPGTVIDHVHTKPYIRQCAYTLYQHMQSIYHYRLISWKWKLRYLLKDVKVYTCPLYCAIDFRGRGQGIWDAVSDSPVSSGKTSNLEWPRGVQGAKKILKESLFLVGKRGSWTCISSNYRNLKSDNSEYVWYMTLNHHLTLSF